MVSEGKRKTLVLGLGNPILSDDSVGCRIARALKDKLDQQGVTVTETSQSGLNLLHLLANFDKAILIDAIQTTAGKPGLIYRLKPDTFEASHYATSSHDVNLAAALELGSKSGMSLPQDIVIFAIEAAEVDSFGEKCTPEVESAIPVCVEMIIRELKGDHDA